MSTALTAEHDAQPQPTVTPFEFRGDGAEFFKIWIVNLLLTILTLGIYSAWAKVRSNRYFYSNVYLEGESFRYLAEPMQILLGRLIAVAFFAVYILAAQLSPLVGGVLIILLTIATPFLVIRSLAFNLRMTAYRNIQFRFDASYGEAAMALLVWPVLGVLSLGLLYPYAMLKSQQFLVRNAAYGTTPFGYEATTWAYGRIFLYFLGILVVVGLFHLVFYFLFPPALIIVMAVGYVVAFGYFTVALTNLYYASAGLGVHGLSADLEMPGYLQIFLTNALFIVLTLGLYLPFAQVRMARYRAEHIYFLANGSLDDFVAAERRQVNALGEEMGEVFDFDIGVV